MRVVVCGAGIVGASVAWFLAERGTGATLVERTGVACAASGKAGGFLALDWCDGTPAGPLARASFALHAELAARLGTDVGYRRVDTWQVVSAEGADVGAYRRHAAPAWLHPEHAAVVRPLGTPATTAQVHPERLTRALVDGSIARGARLVTGTVEGIAVEGSPPRVAGVAVDGEVLPADAVVLAMGPWTGGLSHALGLPPIGGLKGYSVTLRPSQPVGADALFVEHVAAGGERLSPEVYPRPDGEVYVCGLSEHAALPASAGGVVVDPAACDRLQRFAAHLAPALGTAARDRAQACYRPIAGDGMPVIGPVPGAAGAWVATAHSCWGILNAPATGKALAEVILDGGSETADLAPFDPRRLAGGTLRARG